MVFNLFNPQSGFMLAYNHVPADPKTLIIFSNLFKKMVATQRTPKMLLLFGGRKGVTTFITEEFSVNISQFVFPKPILTNAWLARLKNYCYRLHQKVSENPWCRTGVNKPFTSRPIIFKRMIRVVDAFQDLWFCFWEINLNATKFLTKVIFILNDQFVDVDHKPYLFVGSTTLFLGLHFAHGVVCTPMV